jgi:uncharacterized protein (UPF0548 family)
MDHITEPNESVMMQRLASHLNDATRNSELAPPTTRLIRKNYLSGYVDDKGSLEELMDDGSTP